MCGKCECKKDFTWQKYGGDGWHYISPEGEYIAFVTGRSEDVFAWSDRKFVSFEAAKAAVEKAYNPTGPTDADMIKKIRDTIKSATEPSRMGPPPASTVIRAIQRIIRTSQQ